MVCKNWLAGLLSAVRPFSFNFSKPLARRQKKASTAPELLEERSLPTAAIVDVQHQTDVYAYMYADIASQPEEQSPREARQEAREDKKETRQAAHDFLTSMSYDTDGRVERTANATVAKKKDPKPKPDKSGLTVNVTSTTDGQINANASEEVQEAQFINGKKKVTIKSLGGTLGGEGADDVLSVAAKFNGTTVAIVTAQGAGQINLGTFNVGMLKNGTATFEIWVTMKPDAKGDTVTWTTTTASVRHPANSLPLILNTNNVVKSTFTGGVKTPVVETAKPTISGPSTILPGALATYMVGLDHAPIGPVTVTATLNNNSGTIEGQSVFTFTPGNWSAQQLFVRNNTTSTIDQNLVITVTAAVTGSAQQTVVLKGMNAPAETAKPTIMGPALIGNGALGAFTVGLDHAPVGTVIVTVTSNNANGVIEGQNTFTFTTADWSPKTVAVRNTVTGTTDGSVTLTASASTGLATATATLKGVSVSNAMVKIEGTPLINQGGTGLVYVSLTAAPPVGQTVNVTVASLNLAVASLQNGSSLQFDSTNWDVPVPVTVYGVPTQSQVDATAVIRATSATAGTATTTVTVDRVNHGGPGVYSVTFNTLTAIDITENVNLLNISGFNSKANVQVILWDDPDLDGSVNRQLAVTTTDANGAFIFQLPNPLTILKNNHLEVRYVGLNTETLDLAEFGTITVIRADNNQPQQIHASDTTLNGQTHVFHL